MGPRGAYFLRTRDRRPIVVAYTLDAVPKTFCMTATPVPGKGSLRSNITVAIRCLAVGNTIRPADWLAKKCREYGE